MVYLGHIVHQIQLLLSSLRFEGGVDLIEGEGENGKSLLVGCSIGKKILRPGAADALGAHDANWQGRLRLDDGCQRTCRLERQMPWYLPSGQGLSGHFPSGRRVSRQMSSRRWVPRHLPSGRRVSGHYPSGRRVSRLISGRHVPQHLPSGRSA